MLPPSLRYGATRRRDETAQQEGRRSGRHGRRGQRGRVSLTFRRCAGGRTGQNPGKSVKGENRHLHVYKTNTNGTRFTVLHSFGGLDGRNPVDPLIAGPSGDLFGVTQLGGVLDRGTVFKLSTAPAPASSIYYFNFDLVGNIPQVQISFSGASSQHWNLQATTNLLNRASWRTIANSGDNGLLNYVETPSNTNAVRFYRMMHP